MTRKTSSIIFALFIAAALLLVTLTAQADLSGIQPNRQNGCVPGPHHGVLTGDETWCASDSPHLMDGTVTVPATVTLTFEPGTTVKTPGWPWGISLNVLGQINLMGTPTQPITLTSTTGGPTWGGLVVDGGKAVIDHTTIEYACGSTSQPKQSNVYILNGGQLQMANSRVQECHYGGGTAEYNFYIKDSTAAIRQTNLNASDHYPMYIEGASTVVTLTDNIITGNGNDRILLAGGALLGRDTVLTPQSVWDGYELEGTMTVPPTVTLTVEPGVIIKTSGWPWGISLNVFGQLSAMGTTSQPITLTSTTGGTTWGGLVINGGTANLDHTTVEYGCADVIYPRHANIHVINYGRLKLANSRVRECHYGGGLGEYMLRVEDSQAEIQRTSFTNSDYADIYVNGQSSLIVSDSSIEGGSAFGFLIDGNDAWVKVTRSIIASNGVHKGEGIRNTGDATVILGGRPEDGNYIAHNITYGANQTGLTGQIIAPHNWWDDPSGPTHAGNPGGTGEAVSDRVLYTPWLTSTPDISAALPSLVRVLGPLHVSPGDTVNFAVALNNVLTSTLTNAVVIAQLPIEVDYVLSSAGGQYWPQKHQVVWQLGDVTPGEFRYLSTKVRVAWGLPGHSFFYFNGYALADNLVSSDFDLAEYLAFKQMKIISFQNLTDTILTNTLESDAYFNSLFTNAQSQGFGYFGGARSEHLSDGSDEISLVMIDPAKPGEKIFLHHTITDSMAIHEGPTAVTGASADATFHFDTQSGDILVTAPPANQVIPFLRFDGTPCRTAGCQNPTYQSCLRNCLIKNLNSNQFNPDYSAHCNACYTNGTQCSLCASDLMIWRNDAIKNTADMCEQTCNADSSNWQCSQQTAECTTSHILRITPCLDCEYRTDLNTWDVCGAGERCVQGRCQPITPKPDERPVEVITAFDPNDMTGPAEIAPSELITYIIRYENTGEGTAHGVFVESHLPALFDPASLQMNDGGIYFPGSRTLIWQVGSLTSTVGGQVSFQVQVPANTVSGTTVVASANIYFPSVPQTTPTNDVVSLVTAVAAHSHHLQTSETTPVSITLTGYTPSGNTLNFTLRHQPSQGVLSGTPPNLTYAPAANFEGDDWFDFVVDDGVNTSLPAVVSLLVVSGTDTIPPEILVTSPIPDKSGVKVYETDLGPYGYMPFIWAMFTEPMAAASFTDQSIFIQDSQGQHISGTLTYDGTRNTISFNPSQPLKRMEVYTAMVTTAVTDSSGNPLAQTYSWQFTTEFYGMYLPMVLRP